MTEAGEKFPENSDFPELYMDIRKKLGSLLARVIEIAGPQPPSELVRGLCYGATSYLAHKYLDDYRFSLRRLISSNRFSEKVNGHCVLEIKEAKTGLIYVFDPTAQQIPEFENLPLGVIKIIGPFQKKEDSLEALENSYKTSQGEDSSWIWLPEMVEPEEDILEGLVEFVKKGRPTTPYTPLE